MLSFVPFSAASSTGPAVLLDAAKNKTFAFTAEEKDALGIRGFVAAGETKTMDQQVVLAMEGLARCGDDLAKYEFLIRLKNSDERLFYGVLLKHTQAVMPLVYTPVVGRACVEYSRLLLPRGGIYLSLNDKGKMVEILRAWPRASTVKAICVTDGERILGLGDLGANGMGIPVGKLALYTALAGVPPEACLPITLDVGTNTQSILNDPFYTGLRQKRIAPLCPEHLAFMDEFVSSVQQVFGKGCLVQWEDFGNQTAFEILSRYRKVAPSFNDDIEGTAAVTLAALEASVKKTNRPISETVFLFSGAGEAGCGIAELLAFGIRLETGCDEATSRSKIWLLDSKGLITNAREDAAKLAHHKQPFAHAPPAGLDVSKAADIQHLISVLRVNALIGVSAQGGSFTHEICREMCIVNPLPGPAPIIFALSNPTSKAECTADQAYKWTQGRCLFASGSPFDPVHMLLEDADEDGSMTPATPSRRLIPAQANNSWIFPGVGLAVVAAGISEVDDHTFYIAAKAVADCVSHADLEAGCLMPPLAKIRDVSAVVAAKVVEDAYAKGRATHQPKPDDILAFVKAAMYEPRY